MSDSTGAGAAPAHGGRRSPDAPPLCPGEFPGDAHCLPGLIAAQAARTPSAPAVTAAGRTLGYAELHAASDRLALALRDAGVRPEEPVAVCLPRGRTDTVTALLAVLKAGAGPASARTANSPRTSMRCCICPAPRPTRAGCPGPSR
ncbi:AMP-binding protein [Streptomyces orinoci]|uniref:AMP-binding protein n=1 Tax=Streptomyces orinoci TaxID=67339 RepID=A0ABV3JRH5_STRON|nr:AMP-binding protein [Streptomyces orinoci]